jgi:hypothetical protein
MADLRDRFVAVGRVMTLNAAQLAFVKNIDGRRTIREIAERLVQQDESNQLRRQTLKGSAVHCFGRCGESISLR